jgi:hypothetical protein
VVGDRRDEFKELVREIAVSYATQVASDWEAWKTTVPGGDDG